VTPAEGGRSEARDPDAAHALIEAELRWTDAVRRGDGTAAGAFMTGDFASVTAGSPEAPVGRRAWLERVSVPSTLDAFEYDDVRIRVIDDVALVQSRCRERDVPAGLDAAATTFRFTDVWRREGDCWRIGLRHVGLSQT
jgi:ketosteroid isomerase-like protein